jgi:GntR family transcriptional regulator
MSPTVDRQPPYMQITDHYRRQIQDGDLAEGDRLPSVISIAEEWNVAHATAAKAISQLQVEGLILTSPRGSFVAGAGAKATSPQDRMLRARRTGSTANGSETHRVNVAEIVKPPTYVAELFALEQGEQVVRREWVTIEDTALTALTVTWHPAELADPDQVDALLYTTSSSVGTMLADLEQAVGPITRAQDFMHARSADAREAHALGLPVGAPILAGTWLAWAGDRLVEYGEYCLPPRHTLTYSYEVGGADV